MTTAAPKVKIDWKRIVLISAEIVNSYDTGVTLRQLFYRLVSMGELPNAINSYKGLSRNTAKARREGWFPPLIDNGREIQRYRHFQSPKQAKDWLKGIYRRDRMETQEWSIYLGVEKKGMVAQLTSWFGQYDIPILALGGYSSQTYVEDIIADVDNEGRKAVLLYAGDFDPSGEDIDRDLLERTDCFDEVVRVALTPDQILTYKLPEYAGKKTDSRRWKFEARHGKLVQVELDALDPNDLRTLYQEAIDGYFDYEAWAEVVKREKKERDSL